MAGNALLGADHRRNAEELLAQLAGLLQEDRLTPGLRQTRRRRAAARTAILARVRLARGRRRAA